MVHLTDQDIRDAAAEAGISPAELRQILTEQGRDLPALAGEGRGLMAPSSRGNSAASCETALPFAPEQAVLAVRRSLERRIGKTGHMQGSTAADILDGNAGITYHIRAEPDGGSGALVRVDIDTSPHQARRALAVIALGVSVTFLGLIGLFTWPGLAAAAVVGIGGGWLLSRTKHARVNEARALASEVLFDAESDPVPQHARALPPGDRNPAS